MPLSPMKYGPKGEDAFIFAVILVILGIPLFLLYLVMK